MNKVDELLDELQELNINITDEETEMMPDELDRITALALQKADLKAEKKPVYRRKKFVFIAAAAAIVLFSLSIMAAERVAIFFQNALGDNYQYVAGNEQIIQKSDTQNGITVTIKEIIGDEKNVWIIYDITKDNGELFKSTSIRFDHVWVYFPNGSGGSCDENQISYDESNTVTMLYHRDTINPVHGKEGTMVFENLIEETRNESAFDLDISKLFKVHPELLEQSPIINPDKGLGEPTAPEHILPKKGLDRLISSHMLDTKLDNIGFVDGKLHMRLKSTFGGLGYFGRFAEYDEMFFKKANQIVQPIYQGGRGDTDGSYMYLVYDIKDIKELETAKPYVKYPDITKGKWKISFKMDYNYHSKKIKPNILYDPTDKSNTSMIKEVTLSPMSLNIFIEGDTNQQEQEYSPKVEVFSKEGSKIGSKSILTSNESERCIINLSFFHPINMEDVDYITVNNQKIKISNAKEK